tara:strand:+ start:810 stop:1262 length:453 start_codon:yes stop_codon:yes gene_type:complete
MKIPNDTKKAIKKYYNKHYKDSKYTTYEVIEEQFLDDCKRYIKASKQNRLMSKVSNVSKSGMSRIVDIFEIGSDKKYKNMVLNFARLFEIVYGNYNIEKRGVLVKGCGMDMVYHLHDTIIRYLQYRKLMTQSQYENLTRTSRTSGYITKI